MTNVSRTRGHHRSFKLRGKYGKKGMIKTVAEEKTQNVALTALKFAGRWAARLLTGALLVVPIVASPVWAPFAYAAGKVARVAVLELLGKYVTTFMKDPSVLCRVIRTKLDKRRNPGADDRGMSVIGRDIVLSNERLEDDRKVEVALHWLVNKPWKRLGRAEIEPYFDYLESSYEDVQVIKSGIAVDKGQPVEMRKPSELVSNWLKAGGKKEGLVFLPYTYPGHFVGVVIDFTDERIEYYDSRGLTSKKCGFNSKSKDFNMRKELEQVSTKLFNRVNLIENKVRHQEDVHSCGIYISGLFERRAKGETFEVIMTEGKTHDEILDHRDTMAIELDGWWQKKKIEPDLDKLDTNYSNVTVMKKGIALTDTQQSVKPYQDLIEEQCRGKEEGLVFIPYTYPGHIGGVVIDFDKQQVECYDPRGITTENEYNKYNNKMWIMLEKVNRALFPDKKKPIVHNEQQVVVQNYTIYTREFFERRATGQSFEKVMESLETTPPLVNESPIADKTSITDEDDF